MRHSAAALLLTLVAAVGQSADSRFTQLTKKFEKTPDQAKVIAAGHLGSAGTEWLTGGGFQPDGTVVLVGTALGPTLDLGGAKTGVLGKDAPAPAEYKPQPLLDAKGQPQKNKDGTPKLKDPSWDDPAATAFIVRMSSDLKTVKSVSRFPWKSAGATSAAVDADGNIYLAGPATDDVAALDNAQELKALPGGPKSAAVGRTFLAKLNPDASRVLWVRHLAAPSNAPEVALTADGKVKFTGADVRTFAPDGKQTDAVAVPFALGRRTAVSPKDGTIARGGQTVNWHTGREPYRDPFLHVHKPDGKLRYELYHWDGPLVGVDNLRLVSDSELRLVKYDDAGDLIVYAWSDGGNSVIYREPFDVRTPAKEFKGLGMSAWGAGVLSCAYVIKLDPRDYKVTGGTLWLAYLNDKDKPNSIWIDSLGFAGDGSVCVGGRSAFGLIETGNRLNPGDPTGPYVSVFGKDYTSLRFSSALPATAKADVGEGGRWQFARGLRDGRPAVLCLGSAVEKDDKGQAAPSAGGGSGRFAGGATDGYFLLLDLGK
ncbi:MAG: hypothetical protein K2V38_22810 [Gemmataceae bacterium]|nr:hypothetical protein [Gemmataceae bacterium]